MIGRTFSHYKVLKELGQGGMGTVYLAHDSQLDGKVALKFLPDSVEKDEVAHQRFLREAKSAAALDHPYICKIYEAGEFEGKDFIAMEYVEGQTMADKMSEGLIAQPEALRIGGEIAEALEEAHRKGFVHRDLKPLNVMLAPNGHVKVMDFGLAKRVGTDEHAHTAELTREGAVLGTLNYMSPEQSLGSKVDNRSDIFSFGVILYELLTGVHPFRRKSGTQTLAAILREDPSDLSRFNKEVPPSLDYAVKKMLAKVPDQRYQSIQGVRVDLNNLTRRQGNRKPALGKAWVAVLALATILIAVLAVWSLGLLPEPPSGVTQPSMSIAVLPFDNLRQNAEDEYFSDGLTEDIITRLAKIKDLTTISRTSSMLYKHSQKSLREISEELGVSFLLEGTVRRQEDRVRITAQLIDAKTDAHLWADSYDREMSGIFDIQSTIAEQIATALAVKLSPEEKNSITTTPTQSMTAYDYYLEGRDYFSRGRQEDNETAITLYTKALNLDSQFAWARAGLAHAYARRVDQFGYPRSWLDSALKEAQEALAVDPNLAEAYQALGYVYRNKGWTSKALPAAEKAVEIGPNSWTALLNLAMIQADLGRFDETFRSRRKAMIVDPRKVANYWLLGWVYWELADYEKAEEWANTALQIQADDYQAQRLLAWTYALQDRRTRALSVADRLTSLSPDSPSSWAEAGVIAIMAGDERAARGWLEKAMQLAPGRESVGFPYSTSLGYVLWRGGDREAAERRLTQSARMDQEKLDNGDERWRPRFDLAVVSAIRGEKEEAYRWLREAIDSGWRWYDLAEKAPYFESLHDDDRFKRMMAEIRTDVERMLRRVETMGTE